MYQDPLTNFLNSKTDEVHILIRIDSLSNKPILCTCWRPASWPELTEFSKVISPLRSVYFPRGRLSLDLSLRVLHIRLRGLGSKPVQEHLFKNPVDPLPLQAHNPPESLLRRAISIVRNRNTPWGNQILTWPYGENCNCATRYSGTEKLALPMTEVTLMMTS
jgi:hypothetical protein